MHTLQFSPKLRTASKLLHNPKYSDWVLPIVAVVLVTAKFIVNYEIGYLKESRSNRHVMLLVSVIRLVERLTTTYHLSLKTHVIKILFKACYTI